MSWVIFWKHCIIIVEVQRTDKFFRIYLQWWFPGSWCYLFQYALVFAKWTIDITTDMPMYFKILSLVTFNGLFWSTWIPKQTVSSTIFLTILSEKSIGKTDTGCIQVHDIFWQRSLSSFFFQGVELKEVLLLAEQFIFILLLLALLMPFTADRCSTLEMINFHGGSEIIFVS